MARNYSPRSFLRHAPNRLLAEYFEGRKLPVAETVAALDETDIEALYKAWDELPAEERTAIDADFQLIDEMADEQGIQSILEEGRGYHGEDLEPVFAEFADFYDKAFWTFLNRFRYFEVASRFRQADEFAGRLWHKRMEDIPQVTPRDDEEARQELAQAVGAYFQLAQGRGRSCEVDVYRRDDRYYYFCFPEDYGRSDLEFGADGLARTPHRPVFETVFVYSPATALDTYTPGQKKVRQELEQIFGRVILGVDLPPLGKNERVYHLNAFKERGFNFVFDPASGITDIRLKMLRLTVLGDEFRRITLEVDPTLRPDAVYDLLDHTLVTLPGATRTGEGIPLALCNVTQVGIRAYFTDPATERRGKRTFHLGYPNTCDLKQYGRDLLLREMLTASGLEPRRPVAEAAPA